MKKVKEFMLREIAGEYVLVPTGETTQDFNGLVTLTESAKFIWEHIEEADSFEKLVSMLLENYEVDEETAVRESVEFINSLLRMGFLACSKEDRTW